MMYYDLICSLPRLPHFEEAEWLPITPLRLGQRLRRLRPEHAEQLNRARALVGWRGQRMTSQTDSSLSAAFSKLMDTQLDAPLRDYVTFRMTQQTVLAALRLKRNGLELPEDSNTWGVGPRVHHIRKHWDLPFFALERVSPWLPQTAERLLAGDAIGLERLLMELNWQWLTRCAEQSMFGFQAVMAFVFKWDMLQAWLACDPPRAKARFTELIDEVTHVANT